MDLGHTLVLGAIAGITIFLGLPVGRLGRRATGLRTLLTAGSVGVLLFLVWDVLSQAWEPIDAALARVKDGGGPAPLVGLGLLFAACLAVGLLGLVWYEAWASRTARRGAAAAADHPAGEAELAGRRLALLIAVGIGLHNFAEGLAIGQSAASGDIGLATLLVIGFALHNATEGFGITAPLAGSGNRPSWGYLAILGVIGGGPTLIGAAIGHSFVNDYLSVAFLGLAAGSIIYVVVQLIQVAGRSRRADLVAYGILAGLLAGFLTDAIVTLGGA